MNEQNAKEIVDDLVSAGLIVIVGTNDAAVYGRVSSTLDRLYPRPAGKVVVKNSKGEIVGEQG